MPGYFHVIRDTQEKLSRLLVLLTQSAIDLELGVVLELQHAACKS